MKNFDDYTLAIKQHLEAQKLIDGQSILLKPSPAQLRNFCYAMASDMLSKTDEGVFRNFFNVSEGDLLKAIDNVDIERFKAVQNFLTSKNQNTNQKNLNLIAVLSDFNPRPFSRFIKEESDFNLKISKIEKPTMPITNDIVAAKKVWFNSNRNKIGVGLLVIISLFFAGSALSGDDEKKCMQWQTNHYEAISCEIAGVGNFSDIEPFDIGKSALKQINISEKTTFFRNGIPLVYYSKQNKQCEYFNGPGLHPITGKQLRPITTYMINKYVLKVKN